MKAGAAAKTLWPANGWNLPPFAFLRAPGVAMAEPALRGQLRARESMARHVSWRAGGAADLAYLPADLADLQAFLRSRATAEPIWFVGLGSNLLVRDRGLRGTVVLTHWGLRRFEVDVGRHEIVAEAGVACPRIARIAALNGLAGAEFLAGIPGTLGGALAMNAGCYGGETWRVAARVRTIDRRGDLRERALGDYEIGYRSVALKAEGARPQAEEWFVGATLALAHGDSALARERIRELLALRLASQPLNQPNAGSVFRNPPGDHAARLIEACALKGYAIGGAMISPRHANFIVTIGAARAADIEALIELAQRAVRERFGIELEREVRIIGEQG
jgi:UDP-N-acetylmuramate dehydrogenase